jgi:hypothetical protein
MKTKIKEFAKELTIFVLVLLFAMTAESIFEQLFKIF